MQLMINPMIKRIVITGLVTLGLGQEIHSLSTDNIFLTPPDTNDVYSSFDVQHNLSESIYAAAKIEAPIPNTYPPNFSTTDFWPLGSWGRGYYTQIVDYQPGNENYRYQDWYSYVDKYGNTKYWACYPLIRDTGRRIIGYINVIKNVHYPIHFDNIDDRVKKGINYLLNNQATDGGYYYYQNRVSYDNPANENPVTEVYSTGIAMRALYEGYYFLNDVMNDNSLNTDIINSINQASSYLINHRYQLHLSGWGHGGPNIKYFAVWGLISAYKLTGKIDYYNYAKSIAESSFGYHRDDGSWESPVSDSNGPCSITYYKWHDTRIYYHGIIIRGLSELYNVIVNDNNFKSTVKEHIIRSINHIIDYNGVQGNPISRLYSQNGVYDGRIYIVHRDEINENCDPIVSGIEIDGQIISGLVAVRNLVDFSYDDTEKLDHLINCIANGMVEMINNVSYTKRVWHNDEKLMGLGKYIGNIISVKLSNRDLTEINLGGTLSIDQQSIPSGNSYQFLSYKNDVHNLWTGQPELDGMRHLQWNYDLKRYQLKENNIGFANVDIQTAYFTDQHTISISSNINNIPLQLHDPWYAYQENGDWIQPDTFLPLSDQNDGHGNVQVFLNQQPDQGPHYSLRAPKYYATTDAIYEFSQWTASDTDPNDNSADAVFGAYPGHESEPRWTTVVFKQAGAVVTAEYTPVNQIENYTLTITPEDTLLIPAGANITFAEGFALEIMGSLVADGSSEAITFTGPGRDATINYNGAVRPPDPTSWFITVNGANA